MSVVAQPVDKVVALDTTAEIETPEHVRFGYPLAGPTRRALAYALDLLIRLAVMLVLAILLVLVEAASPDGFDGVSTGAFVLVYFVVDWFYYVLFETLWSGRSPGKRALRLRVVSQDGHSLTVLDSILRNLLRAADFLPFGYAVGLVVMGRDPMFRRLGDMVAGTVVVVEGAASLTSRLQLNPPPSAAELDEIPERPDVSRDELEAIELFLRRRVNLAPMREYELADLIAPLIAARMGLRYRDPARFLALIYARARGHEPVELAPVQRWPRRGQAWRGQARHDRSGAGAPQPGAPQPGAPPPSVHMQPAGYGPAGGSYGPAGGSYGPAGGSPLNQIAAPPQPFAPQPQPFAPQPQPFAHQPQPFASQPQPVAPVQQPVAPTPQPPAWRPPDPEGRS